MNDEEIAELIAEGMLTSLTHPGDPENNIKPMDLVLPFQTTGQPEEMVKLINGTVKLMSEAIVHLIKTKGGVDLIPRAEVRELRHAAGQILPHPLATPMFCRCNVDRDDPLAMVTITDPEQIVIDGPSMIRGLSRREIACPHKVKS